MRLLAVCTLALVILAVFIDSINGDESTPPNENVTHHGHHKGLNLLHPTLLGSRRIVHQQLNQCRTACRITQAGTLPIVDPQILKSCREECVQQAKIKITRPTVTG